MEFLVKQFYEVMCKYGKYFSEQGVITNLAKWHENKGPLVSLLRNHPDWDEDAMAIIFQLVESREIDHELVGRHQLSLLALADESQLPQEQSDSFRESLVAATHEYSVSPSEHSIEIIKEKSGIKCVTGQKASRIINKLCQKYGIDRHARYNAVFAQLSDSLNPLEVHKKAVLSVHPCDYLEMSNEDNSWTSCHNLRDGSYQSGCLSYMNDGVTMIFYTIDNEVMDNFSKVPKRARQVFCYADGILLQSRLYPNSEDAEAIKQYRNLVQDTIAACLNVPNRWTLRKNADDNRQLIQTVDESRNYRDYSYWGTVSTLKNMDISEHLTIGEKAFCVCCGETLNRGNVKCGCTNKVVCQDCEQTVPAGNARYIEGEWLCNSCLHICASCDAVIRGGNLFPVFDQSGNMVYVCEACYQNATSPCRECEIQSICSSVGCNRFCQRTAIAA